MKTHSNTFQDIGYWAKLEGKYLINQLLYWLSDYSKLKHNYQLNNLWFRSLKLFWFHNVVKLIWIELNGMHIVKEKKRKKEGWVSTKILLIRHCSFHNFHWDHTKSADCLLRIHFIGSCNRFSPKINFRSIFIDCFWLILLNSFEMVWKCHF